MSILLSRKDCDTIIAEIVEAFGYNDSDFIADRIKRAQLKKLADFLCDYGEEKTLEECWRELTTVPFKGSDIEGGRI